MCLFGSNVLSSALFRSLKLVNLSKCLNRNFSSSHRISKEIDGIKWNSLSKNRSLLLLFALIKYNYIHMSVWVRECVLCIVYRSNIRLYHHLFKFFVYFYKSFKHFSHFIFPCFVPLCLNFFITPFDILFSLQIQRIQAKSNHHLLFIKYSPLDQKLRNNRKTVYTCSVFVYVIRI